LFDYTEPLAYDPQRIDSRQPGIWRYRHTFGLTDEVEPVSLGEGNTPLVWAEAFGLPVAFKCEYLNPSASFKDRGSAVIAGVLRWRGVTHALEDSSGNAGASFAAYAARAGIRARIFAPDSASGPKLAQIEAYGAELVRIMGPRSNAAKAVLRVVDARMELGNPPLVYASHAHLPFNLPGYATLAYELVEQMGGAPGSLLLPVGQGGLLLGAARGFQALREAGVIQRLPVLAGVQARACAPLWALFAYGPAGLSWAAEAPTLAEGIRVVQPLRGDAVLNTIAVHQGMVVAVDEEEIIPGREQLARRGMYVEPTSAVVWGALAQLVGKIPEPIAVVLTGSGLKSDTSRAG
jgi:threonine synthase